jgi:hypothetical protein
MHCMLANITIFYSSSLPIAILGRITKHHTVQYSICKRKLLA